MVNPNRVDQTSPLQHLAAVGRHLRRAGRGDPRRCARRGAFAARPEPPLLHWLDLVALGTVCDVVPLTGLNRAFVHQGLKVARAAGLPGMAALAAAAGLAAITDARQFGFALGPRINAGGRIGRSDLGARLLTTDAADEAADLAGQLHALNAERQAVERGLLEAAQRAVEPQLAGDLPVLLAAGAGWHPGIVGIVASRLVERHHRPVVVLGLADGHREGLGPLDPRLRSGCRGDRGPPAGPAAAGRRPRHGRRHDAGRGRASPPSTASCVERLAAETGAGVPPPEPLELDGVLSVGAAQPALAAQILQLAPYGPGNAEPRFALTDARVAQARIVGDGHVSCTLTGAAGGRVKAIAFRSAASAARPRAAGEPACRCTSPAGSSSTPGRAASRPASRSRTRHRWGVG